MKKVFVCNDTITGIFSAIYEAWKLNPDSTQTGIALKSTMEQELFCEYLEVEETAKKAIAVEKMIQKHLGEEAYGCFYHALLSADEDKGDAVLGAMLAAKKIPDSHKIMNHLGDSKVQRVFELSRKVSNEAHFFKEIVRFRELDNGVLFAKINPQNQILTCIAEHFANRLAVENFIIYDETHCMTLLHQSGKQWFLVSGKEIDVEKIQNVSEEERKFVRLWKGVVDSISIKERENLKLQRQHLPLKYRQNIVEFM